MPRELGKRGREAWEGAEGESERMGAMTGEKLGMRRVWSVNGKARCRSTSTGTSEAVVVADCC